MNLAEYLDQHNVIIDEASLDKAHVLHSAADAASQFITVPVETIFNALCEREKLGSTAIGAGVAIPHALLRGISKPVGLLIRLKSPVEFEAIDHLSVDIVFVLLVPVHGPTHHLNVLSCLFRKLRSTDTLDRIRNAKSALDLHAIFVHDG